jgi:hypothetical protein
LGRCAKRVVEAGYERFEQALIGFADVEAVDGVGEFDAGSGWVGAVGQGRDQGLDGIALGQVEFHPGFLDQVVDLALDRIRAGEEQERDGEDEIYGGKDSLEAGWGAGPRVLQRFDRVKKFVPAHRQNLF